MRTHLLNLCGLATGLLLLAGAARAGSSPSGLWVGEITLNRVNETVVGIDAAGQVAAPNPAVATPANSPAHLRVILHVDAAGQVRLLKSVALLTKSADSNQPAALVTKPSLYANYSGIGRRVTSAAFDFGDVDAVQVLELVATNAAMAAATGENATNAALQTVQAADLNTTYQAFVHGNAFHSATLGAAQSATAGAAARKNAGGSADQVIDDATAGATNDARVVTARGEAATLQAAALLPDSRYSAAVESVALAAASGAAGSANSGISNAATIGLAATNAALVAETNAFCAASPVSSAYDSFIGSTTFQSSAGIAAGAAAAAALQASGSGATAVEIRKKANGAALKALSDAGIFAAADAVVDTEVLLTGVLAPGSSLNGRLYLGASHPTNPFRHRMNPDHALGYAITRLLSIQFDPPDGTNVLRTVGFGVEQITGSYREEIFGLHKPLGPSQNIGLITEGTIRLDHISPVDTLNQ